MKLIGIYTNDGHLIHKSNNDLGGNTTIPLNGPEAAAVVDTWNAIDDMADVRELTESRDDWRQEALNLRAERDRLTARVKDLEAKLNDVRRILR